MTTVGFVPTLVRRSSDLSKQPNKVFSEAELQPLTVTRRDGEDLVLMSKTEADGRAALLALAGQMLVLATNSTGSLTDRFCDTYPWMYALSAADRDACAKDLLEAARASFATEQPTLILNELRSWQETATALAAGLRPSGYRDDILDEPIEVGRP